MGFSNHPRHKTRRFRSLDFRSTNSFNPLTKIGYVLPPLHAVTPLNSIEPRHQH